MQLLLIEAVLVAGVISVPLRLELRHLLFREVALVEEVPIVVMMIILLILLAMMVVLLWVIGWWKVEADDCISPVDVEVVNWFDHI